MTIEINNLSSLEIQTADNMFNQLQRQNQTNQNLTLNHIKRFLQDVDLKPEDVN